MYRSSALIIEAVLLSTLVNGYDFTDFHEVEASDAAEEARIKPPSFKIYYKVDDDDMVTFGAEVVLMEDEWFSVGVTSSGGMIGADMVILTSQNGEDYTLGDYWSSSFSKPTLDKEQNVELLESSRAGSLVTAVWRRPVTSCDQNQDLDLDTHSMVIYAVGHGPELSYHKWRGSQSVDWTRGDDVKASIAALESDAFRLELKPSSPIRLHDDTKTQYKCAVLPSEIPDRESTPVDYHAIAIEPIIGSPYIHHMLYFFCESEIISYDGQEYGHDSVFDCSVMIPSGCDSLGGWAVGARPEYLNKKFGRRLSSSYKTFFVQYHYDNYDKLKGIQDASGAIFTLTPSLRAHDEDSILMAVPATGTNEISIPPGEKNFHLSIEIPVGCSEKMVQDSVTITGVTFHMHQYGTMQFLEHWRDGERLPDVAWQYWDFNFQTGQRFPPERWVEFKRGDELRCNCIYDTTEATAIVKGGDGSNDEMCICTVQTFPPSGVKASLQMDKVMTLARQGNQVVCMTGSVEEGKGGFSAVSGISSLSTQEKLALIGQQASAKSIHEGRVERQLGPQARCTEQDLYEAHAAADTEPAESDQNSASCGAPGVDGTTVGLLMTLMLRPILEASGFRLI